MFFKSKKTEMPTPIPRCPARGDLADGVPPLRERAGRSKGLIRRAARWPCSGLDDSGVQSASSGNSETALSSQAWGMQGADPESGPMKRSVRDGRDITRLCSSSSIHQISYGMLLKTFWESHDPTQATGRETTSARSTARGSILQRRAAGGGGAVAGGFPGEPCRCRFGRITTRSCRLRRSSGLRTTTSSIWPKSRTGPVAWRDRCVMPVADRGFKAPCPTPANRLSPLCCWRFF